MPSFTRATCSNCKRPYGWRNEERPHCPFCNYVEKPDPEVEARLKALAKKMMEE